MENSTTGSVSQLFVMNVQCLYNDISQHIVFVRDKNPPRVVCEDICDIDIFISLYFKLIVFSCVSLCLSI